MDCDAWKITVIHVDRKRERINAQFSFLLQLKLRVKENRLNRNGSGK